MHNSINRELCGVAMKIMMTQKRDAKRICEMSEHDSTDSDAASSDGDAHQSVRPHVVDHVPLIVDEDDDESVCHELPVL